MQGCVVDGGAGNLGGATSHLAPEYDGGAGR